MASLICGRAAANCKLIIALGHHQDARKNWEYTRQEGPETSRHQQSENLKVWQQTDWQTDRGRCTRVANVSNKNHDYTAIVHFQVTAKMCRLANSTIPDASNVPYCGWMWRSPCQGIRDRFQRQTDRSGTPLTLSTLTSFICGIRDLRQGRLEIKVNSLTGTGKAEDLIDKTRKSEILLGVALVKV